MSKYLDDLENLKPSEWRRLYQGEWTELELSPSGVTMKREVEETKPDFPQAGTPGFVWHLLKKYDWSSVCGLKEDEGDNRFTSSQSRVTCPRCIEIILKEEAR